MNMMKAVLDAPARLTPPIALLRALPPGPLTRQYQHLERQRRLADLFAAFDRDDMEAGVELLLAELDGLDGDPDQGPNDDELDGSTAAEDEFMAHSLHALGCPLADPGENDDDDRGIEDDPRGCDSETDFGGEELGELTTEETGGGSQGVGARAYDADEEPDGWQIRKPFRDRARRAACDVEVVRGHWGTDRRYSLKRGSAAANVMAMRP